MKKTKFYYKTRFGPQVIEEVYNAFLSLFGKAGKGAKPTVMSVSKGNVKWDFDVFSEFLAEVAAGDRYRILTFVRGGHIEIACTSSSNTEVDVDSKSRPDIESIFSILERHVDESKIVTKAHPVSVFIGHGRDPQWRDLKDHLHEQHGFNVTAYEIGPRAGMSVKEVLERMLTDSSFALLVFTGEDIHADGELHARENVIHEVGLFQGKLGFLKSIMLLEEGVKEFSNILGVNQIRFGKGHIRETFGDVIATIKREFEDEDS